MSKFLKIETKETTYVMSSHFKNNTIKKIIEEKGLDLS